MRIQKKSVPVIFCLVIQMDSDFVNTGQKMKAVIRYDEYIRNTNILDVNKIMSRKKYKAEGMLIFTPPYIIIGFV